MHAVVDLLAVDLRRQAGDVRVGRRLELLEPQLVGRLVEDPARDRPRPVGHEPELDELRARVLLGRSVERERVGVVGEQLVDRARVPDLVLRDRRQRDVLLEERRDARPLGVAPAEHQLVVSYLEKTVPARSRASPSFALRE